MNAIDVPVIQLDMRPVFYGEILHSPRNGTEKVQGAVRLKLPKYVLP